MSKARLTVSCPHCKREYQLRIDRDRLSSSHPKALCGRCRKRFSLKMRAIDWEAEQAAASSPPPPSRPGASASRHSPPPGEPDGAKAPTGAAAGAWPSGSTAPAERPTPVPGGAAARPRATAVSTPPEGEQGMDSDAPLALGAPGREQAHREAQGDAPSAAGAEAPTVPEDERRTLVADRSRIAATLAQLATADPSVGDDEDADRATLYLAQDGADGATAQLERGGDRPSAQQLTRKGWVALADPGLAQLPTEVTASELALEWLLTTDAAGATVGDK